VPRARDGRVQRAVAEHVAPCVKSAPRGELSEGEVDEVRHADSECGGALERAALRAGQRSGLESHGKGHGDQAVRLRRRRPRWKHFKIGHTQ
jgi:hypothetical protein